jgi:hypothetical protein
MRALDPREGRAGGVRKSFLTLAVLAPLAVGLAAAGGGAVLLAGAVVPLGLLVAGLVAAWRGTRSATVFTWQEVQLGMERELRRTLRRQRWRRLLHLGAPPRRARETRVEKTSA